MHNYEEMMQEVDRRMSAIDLNGSDIINDCRTIIGFLKKKQTELKAVAESQSFGSDADEITYFKHYKPLLLGRLIYFHKILHIESARPPCEDMLDEYYTKRQEELKLFFDRHVAFYQYYKSGGTHLDEYYFLRRQEEKRVNIHVYHFDDDFESSTGYDHLVARFIAMELFYAYLVARKRALQQSECEGLLNINGKYKWTGNAIELVELAYGLSQMQSINGGDVPIQELVAFVATSFGIEVKDCYSAYTDMKRRKSGSRTYYLDKMRERLNGRMEQDDERERGRK
jgi:hypothetical protein